MHAPHTVGSIIQVLGNKGLQLQVVQSQECLVLSRVMYVCLSAYRVELPFTT